MKAKFKKLGAFCLALLLCVTAVLGNAGTAEAADYTYLLEVDSASASAYTPVSHDFTVPKDGDVDFLIGMSGAPVGFRAEIRNSAGITYNEFTAYASDSTWLSDSGDSLRCLTYDNMDAGDYTLVLTFDSDVPDYFCYIAQEKSAAQISNTKVTLTAGFKKTLKVSDGTVQSWTSSKKSVATVSSKGVVTAKKAGKTTITAKTTDGQTLQCVVTVKNNVYSKAKYTNSSAPYGDCTMYVYKASYDKHGNLVMKARFINNYYYRVTALKNVKVTMKTDSGKTIGTYSIGKKGVSVASGSYKDFTFTIKKSKLKVKKADLRNATSSCNGSYYYRY